MTAEFTIKEKSELAIRYAYAISCQNYQFDFPVKIKITAYRLNVAEYISPILNALKGIVWAKVNSIYAENKYGAEPKVEVVIEEDADETAEE